MPKADLHAKVTPTRATKAKLKKLSYLDITPGMRKEMLKATSPAVPAVRARIRAIPSQHESTQSPGLKESLLKAVKRKTFRRKNTVQVIVHMKGSGLANLARAVEGAIPWVHPTFEHEPIVEQTAQPFFHDPLNELQALVGARMKMVSIKIQKQV
jgi:hypothetical protein